MSGGSGTGTQGSGGAGTAGKPGKLGKITNPFGGGERLTNSSLEGVLYDLKQTREGKSSGMDATKYVDVLREFFQKDWNRRVLDDYFRVKNPLYTNQIYIPLMAAVAAPKAFQVEKEVKASQWVILYEGAFQVPKSGQYRLAGYADDMLVVRVNGKAVLDGSRMTIGFDNKLSATLLVKVTGQEIIKQHTLGNGVMAYSEWISFQAGMSNKIEILVGERPGGNFCAFLFVQEKNKKYQEGAGGRPILPLFRTADMKIQQSSSATFAEDGPVFGMQ